MALSEKFFFVFFTGIKGRYRCGIILGVRKSSKNQNIHGDNFGLNICPVTMWHKPAEQLSDLKGLLFQ